MGLAARGATLVAVALLIPACNLIYTSNGSSAGPPPPQNPFTLQIPTNGAYVMPNNTQFSWGALAGAQSYQLQISLTWDFAQILYDLPNLSIPTVILQVGLTHATLYYWRVFGVAGGTTRLAGGSPFQFTTLPPSFGIPDPFFLQSPIGGVVSTSLSPLFRWTSSLGAVVYSFQLDVTSSFSNPLVDLPVLHLNQVQCPVTLASQTTYYWRVTAGNSFGQIDSSPLFTSFVAGP